MSGRDTRIRRVYPLEALEVLVGKRNPRQPTVVSPMDPEARYLAETLELPVTQSSPPCATRNGYAVGPVHCGPHEAGVAFRILGTLTPGGTLDANGEPSDAVPEVPRADAVSLWRVETGAPLPADVDRVVEVSDGVLVGSDEVRFDLLPAPGCGTTARQQASKPARVPAGDALDARLRAMLIAAGVESVAAWPRFTVGIVAFGDELVAAGTPPVSGTRWDLTGPWLEEAVAALGLQPVSLGIRPDAPEQMDELLFRASQRDVRVLLMVGGLGDGVTDRTVDGLRRTEAHVFFERVDCVGLENLLFAKTKGIEVIGLSGRPLEAALGFDLFARPALLARLGARTACGDWRRSDTTPAGNVAAALLKEARWEILPAASLAASETDTHLPHWPRLPTQEGWIVRAMGPEQGSAGSEPVVLAEWRTPAIQV